MEIENNEIPNFMSIFSRFEVMKMSHILKQSTESCVVVATVELTVTSIILETREEIDGKASL